MRNTVIDWTTDLTTGQSNSSPQYLELIREVEKLIKNSAHDLIGGNLESVARLIVSQLAHKHGMAPRNEVAAVDQVRAAAESIVRAVKPNPTCRAETYTESVALEKAQLILSILPKT